MMLDTMQKRIALAISAITLLGLLIGGWTKVRRNMDAWAQAMEARVEAKVQASVGQKLDDQAESLDRLMCAVYYGKPQPVCDCEAVESQQAEPNMARCERIAALLEAGRPREAAALSEAVP